MCSKLLTRTNRTRQCKIYHALLVIGTALVVSTEAEFCVCLVFDLPTDYLALNGISESPLESNSTPEDFLVPMWKPRIWLHWDASSAKSRCYLCSIRSRIAWKLDYARNQIDVFALPIEQRIEHDSKKMQSSANDAKLIDWDCVTFGQKHRCIFQSHNSG